MDESKRLLVIDDQPEIRSFVTDVAEGIGFETGAADTLQQLVSVYRDLQPNVIILDLRMPDMDGIQVLHTLAGENCTADILLFSAADAKVINTTARVAAEQGLRITNILPKPISVDDLESILLKLTASDPVVTEDNLRTAIEQNQIAVHFQPKVSLTDGPPWTVEGVEALVRWNHPEMGAIAPGQFIPLAEKTGLIHSLTYLVVDKALRTVSELNDAYPLQVAVNLSSLVLADPDIPDHFAQTLQKYQLDTSRLIVEITESAAMADSVLTMENLTRFRLIGMELSMDDFGTGYSSLVQLHRMPFSELKIDQSFVLQLDSNEEARVIVRSIIELAHNLGLKVCAEGIETQEALDFLRSAGCDQAQGYFISKPLTEADLIRFMAEESSNQAASKLAVGSRG